MKNSSQEFLVQLVFSVNVTVILSFIYVILSYKILPLSHLISLIWINTT